MDAAGRTAVRTRRLRPRFSVSSKGYRNLDPQLPRSRIDRAHSFDQPAVRAGAGRDENCRPAKPQKCPGQILLWPVELSDRQLSCGTGRVSSVPEIATELPASPRKPGPFL